MRNVNGEELLDWMAVLTCGHVINAGSSMPASMGDPMCAQLQGGEMTCARCRTSRTVTKAGLWDQATWEQARDKRWQEEHLASLAHHLGRCPCDPAPEAARAA